MSDDEAVPPRRPSLGNAGGSGPQPLRALSDDEGSLVAVPRGAHYKRKGPLVAVPRGEACKSKRAAVVPGPLPGNAALWRCVRAVKRSPLCGATPGTRFFQWTSTKVVRATTSRQTLVRSLSATQWPASRATQVLRQWFTSPLPVPRIPVRDGRGFDQQITHGGSQGTSSRWTRKPC